jgi:hypothetical protein
MPGPRPLKRLTGFELINTVRDLLGQDVPPAALWPPLRPNDWPVRTPALEAPPVRQPEEVEQLLALGEQLGRKAVENLPALLPAGCTPLPVGTAAEEACARQFIARFGLRAFRRPLAVEEQEDLVGLYQRLRGPEIGDTFPDAIAGLIASMLQSPFFLYRWEGGPPTRAMLVGSLVQLDGYEIASRLSYFIWASMPDDPLLAAAGAGELATADRIAAQARRLLADRKAKQGLAELHRQWLGLAGLEDLAKANTFTSYSPVIARLMLAETDDFVASVFQGPQADGKLGTLLTSSMTIVDPVLASFYGAQNVTGPGARPVALDPKQRAGILTQGSFLAAHAASDHDDPVSRGMAVLSGLLCAELQPPGAIIEPLPPPKPGETTRQRYESHTSAALCQGCHRLVNGLGFAFSHYDAVGAYRTVEAGMPVDARGSVQHGPLKLEFADAIDLVKQLAASPDVRACVTRQWARWLLRRRELPGEQPALDAAAVEAGAAFDLRELVVGLTRTRLFSHRALSPGEPPP